MKTQRRKGKLSNSEPQTRSSASGNKQPPMLHKHRQSFDFSNNATQKHCYMYLNIMYNSINLKSTLQLDKLSTTLILHHFFRKPHFLWFPAEHMGMAHSSNIQSLTGLVQLGNRAVHGCITKEFVLSVNSVEILKCVVFWNHDTGNNLSRSLFLHVCSTLE